MQVNEEEVEEIFSQTVGQRNNSLWSIYRKGRITASNFGLVLKATTKQQYSSQYTKTLNGEYNTEASKSFNGKLAMKQWH